MIVLQQFDLCDRPGNYQIGNTLASKGQKMTPTYDRSPSEQLHKLLSQGEFLASLLGLSCRRVADCELDVHFRPDDEVHVYCGLTKLITVHLASNGTVQVSMHETYSRQPCAKDLCRQWKTSETGFNEALFTYLSQVIVEPRHVDAEGSVQTKWARVTEPWIPFDREAVLSYESKKDSEESRKFDQVDKARAKLDVRIQHDSRRWAKLPEKLGGELDQIAVDSKGNLVLVELKDAATSGVYYAPLQLLQYVWEWHNALEAVRSSLQKLLNTRVALGLTPACAPPITGGIRAAIGFGIDCRSKEVRRRYDIVLNVVNAYLPPGVLRIETWSLPSTSGRIRPVPILSERV